MLIDIILLKPGQKISDIALFTEKEKLKLFEKRKQTSAGGVKPIRLAVSATFTSEPIKDFVIWWGKESGMDIEVKFCPYNQIFQELLDKASLTSTNTGVNLLLVRFEDWIRDDRGSDQKKCEKLESTFREVIKILKAKQKKIPYFVAKFPISNHSSLSRPLINYMEDLTIRWQDTLEKMDSIYLVDFTEIAEMYSIDEVFDAVKDREGHLPFSDEFYAAMGTIITRKIHALYSPVYKAIVLDCDNTLWRGICGEDGPLGVSVDKEYRELQKFMLRKYKEGMILLLCARNNEIDVWDVFEKNKKMLLKKGHFVTWRINWGPKSENIKELADELNLGIDSFIFVDDDPVECSEVAANCPEVLTLQLPEKPHEIPILLKQTWAFDRLKTTKEDKTRSQMYVEEKRRSLVQEKMPSLEDFLKSLELKVSMELITPEQVPRAAQLTQRTNQFNLSTIRRTEEDIKLMLQEKGIRCWVIDVKDKFGDYGLVGVVIAAEKERYLFIDTFLLSCRVLGRRVEDNILACLKEYAQKKGFHEIKAKFRMTKKNIPFLEFLERTSWKKVKEREDYIDYLLTV